MLTGRQAQKIVTTDASDGSTVAPATSPAAATLAITAATSPTTTGADAAAAAAANAADEEPQGGFDRVQHSLQGLCRSKMFKLWRLVGGRKLKKWPADKCECVITVLNLQDWR
jgi:hypothetical protein